MKKKKKLVPFFFLSFFLGKKFYFLFSLSLSFSPSNTHLAAMGRMHAPGYAALPKP